MPRALAYFFWGGGILVGGFLIISFVLVWMPRGGQSLYIDRALNEPTLRQLQEADLSEVESIVLRSVREGDVESAIGIARILKGSGKPIIIVDECIGPCLYVLIINGDVRVEPGTTVGLMITQQAAVAVAYGEYPAVAGHIYETTGRMEREWFLENGVDPLLALSPAANLGGICLGDLESDTPEQAQNLVVRMDYLMWVPPLSVKSRYGLSLKGDWTDDPSDIPLIEFIDQVQGPIEMTPIGGAELSGVSYDEAFAQLAAPRCEGG